MYHMQGLCYGLPHVSLSPTAGHRNCPKTLGLLKPIDMTIHSFLGKIHFLNFSQKTSVPDESLLGTLVSQFSAEGDKMSQSNL
jgi:hypothetical protein